MEIFYPDFDIGYEDDYGQTGLIMFTKNKNLEASSDHLTKSFLKVSDDKSKLFNEKQSLMTENKTNDTIRFLK
jgi:hypothetical protein